MGGAFLAVVTLVQGGCSCGEEPHRVSAIAAGDLNLCALAGARAECRNIDIANSEVQNEVPDLRFQQVGLGSSHGCGVTLDSEVVCWGDNWAGQTDGPEGRYRMVFGDYSYSCGLTGDGEVRCWGIDPDGRAIEDPEGSFATISRSCGVTTSGSLECWVHERHGLMEVPAGTYEQVSTDSATACAVDAVGAISCWGNKEDTVAGAPGGGGWSHVAVGHHHACALDSDGEVTCWGTLSEGLDDPPDGPFVQLTAGLYFACALRGNGEVECFGCVGDDPAWSDGCPEQGCCEWGD